MFGFGKRSQRKQRNDSIFSRLEKGGNEAEAALDLVQANVGSRLRAGGIDAVDLWINFYKSAEECCPHVTLERIRQRLLPLLPEADQENVRRACNLTSGNSIADDSKIRESVRNALLRGDIGIAQVIDYFIDTFKDDLADGEAGVQLSIELGQLISTNDVPQPIKDRAMELFRERVASLTDQSAFMRMYGGRMREALHDEAESLKRFS